MLLRWRGGECLNGIRPVDFFLTSPKDRFCPANQIHKQVKRIVTDSKRSKELKGPEECNVFAIYRHFADVDAIEAK